MRHAVFPQAIEIQTVSACNARCVICPHPQVSQELPKGMMSMDMFRMIIDQVEPAWECRIIPYLNSEPLLDPFMATRLQYIAERLRDPEIELSTNLSTLTPTKQDSLNGVPLRELRLSIFGFTETTHRSIMPGLNWGEVKKNLDFLVTNVGFRASIRKISIVMVEHPLVTPEDVRLAQEYCSLHSLVFNFWGFLDRSGNVEQYSNDVIHPIVVGCEQHRPLERMHISVTGEVILCCQDWRWRNVIGNVGRQPLLDIWNSDAYNRYRDSIYAGMGEQPEICTRCKLSVEP